MSEYIERYDDFARFLVSQGFAVCAEDHIGHGATAPTKADWGVLPAEGGTEILLSDVRHLHVCATERFPATPSIMYGHSMGSFIARAYIAWYGGDLAAAVLSGTASTPLIASRFGHALASYLAKRKGERYVSPFLDRIGAGSYGQRIKDARTPFDWLSHDAQVVDAYIADERCGFPFSVGGYATLTDLTARIDSLDGARGIPVDLPLLFVSGAEDPVGDCGAGVRRAAELARKAGVRRVEVRLYQGMRHEIHNEYGRDQVYRDVVDWMGAVL